MAGLIHVHVKYWNLVRDLAGRSTEEITLGAGSTLGGLLDELRARHGRDLDAFLRSPTGEVNPHVRLFLNGKALVVAEVDHRLADGDSLSIFSAVSGG